MKRHVKAELMLKAVDMIHVKYPGTYSQAVVYDYDGTANDGATEYSRIFPPGSIGFVPLHVYIGTKEFDSGVDADGMARDEDCVWLAFQALHEGAHVWQHCHGFMQHNPDNRLRMMSMDSLAKRWLPEYNKMAYLRNTCELQADMRASKHIKDVFNMLSTELDPVFGCIDVDSIVVSKERNRRGRQISELYKCKTAKDVSRLYNTEIDRCMFLRRFDFDWLNSKNKLYSGQLKTLCSSDDFILALNQPDGAQSELDIVCKIVSHVNPFMFNGLAGIRSTYLSDNMWQKAVAVSARIMRMSERDGPGLDDIDKKSFNSGQKC